MKAEQKKRRERTHLRRFRENLAGFPNGNVVSHESPDFLVETLEGLVGIEHTEYFRGPEGSGDLPPRAREHAEDKLLWLASRRYESEGLPPVVVHTHWTPYHGLASSGLGNAAAALAEFVAQHLPDEGSSATIRCRCPGRRSLPQGLISLTVYRSRSLSRNSWASVRGGFFPTLASTGVQELISGKEVKLPAYRQHCDEVWLLIVANGFEPSTFCKLDPEVENFQFTTGFDRVFFQHFDGLVVELNIRR